MIKVLELFGGIGAPRRALENLKIPHQVVDYVEIDKHAVDSYNAIYGESFLPQDIRNGDKDISVDMLVHGSPCTQFSVAGDRTGGIDGSGTESSLMWETVRIITKLKPKYILWENVRNTMNFPEYKEYKDKLESMGYTNHEKVINPTDIGGPTSRPRVFVISILGNEDVVGPAEKKVNRTQFRAMMDGDYVPEAIACERPNYTQSRQHINEKCKILNYAENSNCITLKQDRYPNAGIVILPKHMFDAKLTPFRYVSIGEAGRLMGFRDEDTDKMKALGGKIKAMERYGNSICVPVLEGIFKNLLNK